jgi:hypothetical protein
VSWTVILPAVAVVSAMAVLTVSFQRLEHEVVLLRASMRRARRAAVATDELQRLTAGVATRAAELDATERLRRHWPRSRRRPDNR